MSLLFFAHAPQNDFAQEVENVVRYQFHDSGLRDLNHEAVRAPIRSTSQLPTTQQHSVTYSTPPKIPVYQLGDLHATFGSTGVAQDTIDARMGNKPLTMVYNPNEQNTQRHLSPARNLKKLFQQIPPRGNDVQPQFTPSTSFRYYDRSNLRDRDPFSSAEMEIQSRLRGNSSSGYLEFSDW